MKKLFLPFFIFLLVFLLNVMFSKQVHAQQCSAQCTYGCDLFDPVDFPPGWLTLHLEQFQCNPNVVSYVLEARLNIDLGRSYVDIYSESYTITHRDSNDVVVYTIQNDQEIHLFDCFMDLHDVSTCPVGSRVTIATISDNEIYPDNEVNIETNVDIEMHHDPFDETCLSDIFSTSTTCTRGGPPPPSGCNPDSECGAHGQCLLTQICDNDGNCVLSPQDCPCDTGGSGDCGGGNCPPTHYCREIFDNYGQCTEDPINCHACFPNSDICGESGCNIRQKCIGGYCRFRMYECSNPQDWKERCIPNYPLGMSGYSGVKTAIGCIPVITDSITPFTQFFLRWAIGIAGGIAFLLIIYAAFLIITSSGNPQRLAAGKELLTAALAGLLFVIFSVFILRLIGADVLKIPNF